MTRQDHDRSAFAPIVSLVLEHGTDDLADAFTLLLNEAMKVERSRALAAEPYQRTDSRQGHANGFKPKTLNTRLGQIDVEAYPYLALDARYEKVRVDGTVISCAVLIAVGISATGKRAVLGVSVALSEAEVHWRDFLASLQDRGLHGVTFLVSDDHSGLRAALSARFAGIPWQRCQFHLQQNAQHHCPKNRPPPPARRRSPCRLQLKLTHRGPTPNSAPSPSTASLSSRGVHTRPAVSTFKIRAV